MSWLDSFEHITRGLLALPAEELGLDRLAEDSNQLLPTPAAERKCNSDDAAVKKSVDFSELLSFEPEEFRGSFCEDDLQPSSPLFPRLYSQSAEILHVGSYKDAPGTPDLRLFRLSPIAKQRLAPPDISSGLGSRQESKDKKCMRWSFGLPTDITPGCAVRSVKQRPRLSVYAGASRI